MILLGGEEMFGVFGINKTKQLKNRTSKTAGRVNDLIASLQDAITINEQVITEAQAEKAALDQIIKDNKASAKFCANILAVGNKK